MLVYMFRELISYGITHITSSGNYSLVLQHTPIQSFRFLSFWSGNIFQQVCVGTGPRGVLIPKKSLALMSSLLCLFESPPNCISQVDMREKRSSCLVSVLNCNPKPSIVSSFSPAEFEKCLVTPTANLIERHDFRTIIDYLLLKLRTALDRDWVHSLPVLHKVVFYLQVSSSIHSKNTGDHFLSFQSMLTLEYTLAEASALIECFFTNWDRIKDHLTQVSRMPEYRFHMREVSVPISIPFPIYLFK